MNRELFAHLIGEVFEVGLEGLSPLTPPEDSDKVWRMTVEAPAPEAPGMKVGNLPEELTSSIKSWDIGDIVGAAGAIVRTQKGELSIRASELRLLSSMQFDSRNLLSVVLAGDPESDSPAAE